MSTINHGTQLLELIRDDAYAASFQSLGQYRKALMKVAEDAAAAITTVPLAQDHTGSRICASGLLGRIRDGRHFPELKFGCGEMLRHLQELAQRYYAGDIAAVDEFLQLYCLDEDREKAVAGAEVSAAPQPAPDVAGLVDYPPVVDCEDCGADGFVWHESGAYAGACATCRGDGQLPAPHPDKDYRPDEAERRMQSLERLAEVLVAHRRQGGGV